MRIKTINPATEEVLNQYLYLTPKQLKTLIDNSYTSYIDWKKTTFADRKRCMLALAKCLRDQQTQYALLMAQEMGKPLRAGEKEIEKCAWVCEHYAQEAETYLAPRHIDTSKLKSMVCYQPLGVVFAIMPWNFPFWQVFRFAAPTLMAGNAAILKHAPISTGTGNAIAELFAESGFPPHLFQHAIVDNDMAAEIIAHDHVVAVTLTGSEKAGKTVASHAARHLKKAVLELGGSDPYLVLEDADLDWAAKCIVESRMNNSGQTCVAAKRIIVLESVAEPLIDKIIFEMNQHVMGDPLQSETTLGPLAREDLRATLHQQVTSSQQLGARLRLGGILPPGRGYFYPPTLLTDVKPGMPAFDEELFGPVVAVTVADNDDAAIQLANQSRYGLGAAVFTRDVARGEKIAIQDLEAGTCFVNDYVVSDPRLPFGGIKRSGYGRELSREGILEFVNIKTVVVHA